MTIIKKKKGFTLIELLIVIAIIAILAAIIFASTGGARAKARDAQRVANLKEIHDAILMYEGDNPGQYPNSLSELTTDGKYLSALAKDPLDKTDFFYGKGISKSGAPGFILGANLERGLEEDPKGPLSQDIDGANVYGVDCGNDDGSDGDDNDCTVGSNPKLGRYCYCIGIP
ncbi:MAG: prepilin-type N-terminal cleavage/methylation domain-containing protein [Candidatus Pacebacteria bacterium]|nr:prepilin-type N-terminal cleavage/methylation domain-containing protein [Candidatus Paceibacterota bacterium]